MIKRVNIRSVWTIVVSLAMIATTAVQAAAVIYEPFADSNSTLTGNTPGTGLTGTWTLGHATTWSVASTNLLYGSLSVAGNRATGAAQGGNYITTGTVADNSLKTAGLLADSATLWFSFLWKMDDAGVSNGDAGFAFGTSALSGANAIPLTAAGSAIGVSMSTSSGNLSACTWGPGSTTRSSSTTVGWGTRTSPKLIVGKITWGSDGAQNDTIEIYTPGTNLALPGSPVCSKTAVLDQSLFNIIAFATKTEGDPQIDEIRFGANYADVVPLETVAPTLLSITDDKAGGPIGEDVAEVTYTLTFDKHMDLSTITAADFDNAGTATATVGTPTQVSQAVIRVKLLPTTTGTLQLRIPSGSVLSSFVPLNLDTTTNSLDDTTITINSGTTPVAGTLYWDGPTTSGITDGASQGGTATWDTTTTNWDLGAGFDGPFAWNNSASSSAVFGGATASATVTLTEAITLSNMTFTSSGNYTIAGSTLNFVTGGTIDQTVAAKIATITSAITGSPTVRVVDSGGYVGLVFAPTNGSQQLGVCTVPYEGGLGDKSGITLAGTTTGNTVQAITFATGNQYADAVLQSGTWSILGGINIGTIKLEGGTFTLGGTVGLNYNEFRGIGGKVTGVFTLYAPDRRSAHYFNSGAIIAPGSNGVGTVTVDWGTGGTPVANTNIDYSVWFKSGSIYEWEIGATGQDKIHFTEGRLYADTGMVLKVLNAGGAPKATDQLPVFTYDAGVTRNLGTITIDTSALTGGWTGTPSLVDNGTGIIYLTGLEAPAAGTVIQLK